MRIEFQVKDATPKYTFILKATHIYTHTLVDTYAHHNAHSYITNLRE